MPTPSRRSLRLRIARRSRHVWLSRSLWNRRAVFLVGSVATGLAAVGFAIAATYANVGLGRMIAERPWAPFLLAPLGLMLVSHVGRRYFPGAEGSGIPQTIAALGYPDERNRERLLSIRTAVAKAGLTIVGLLSGASIGREGPTVQIGAAIMYSLSRFSSFPQESMKRGLILAGGAAGIAAAFNAPLAGVVFAIEEMSRSFSQRTSGIVITAVIVAGIVSYSLLGNYAYFGQTAETLDLASGWSAVVLCGTVGGLLGGTFSRILIMSGSALDGPLAILRRTRPLAFAALCGLAIACLGALSEGTIYGTGYAETRRILQDAGGVPLGFGVLKLLATVISYAAGIPGGIFSPSLAVGAGLGQDIAALLPAAPVAAVAVIGMVSYFSGVVQAPITAFVIVLEMTRDSDMALPVMAASLIAYGFSRLVCPQPVYKALSKSFRPARAAARTDAA
ncbi:MAG TPA: chloride channel protein [Usitatibacter sp.]|nr:chloride channel protein [Usitatibacter sp.]